MIISGFWKRFRRNGPAVIGLGVLGLVVAAALLASVLRPGDPWSVVGPAFLWPGEDSRFPLGTDILGRDILSGLLYGARVSLAIGFTATLISSLVGTIIGLTAGYYGRWTDDGLMRMTEAFQTIPAFLLAIIVIVLFQPSMPSIISAIALISWPGVARLVRAETLRLREADFIAACRTFGMSDLRILLTQILPNCLAPLIVATSVSVATAILMEAGLSFLGLGDPTRLSWGTMISIGRDGLRTAWYVSALPGVAILITVMAVNLIGDGLNDALNPRRRERPS